MRLGLNTVFWWTIFQVPSICSLEDPVPEDVDRLRSSVNIQTYKTEPTFNTAKFSFIQQPQNESLLSPGYLFVTANGALARVSKGAQIYDNKGNLVWHYMNSRVQDLKISDHRGSKGAHLSVYSFKQHLSFFLDQTYYELPEIYNGTNGHEFNVLPEGGTVLRLVDNIRHVDLSSFTGSTNGYVLDVCLMELQIPTARELFRWCPLDYVPLWHTTAYPLPECLHDKKLGKINDTMRSRKAGCATTDRPWDYSHGNAADKFDGDYIFSSRFLNQIMKIAGPNNGHGVQPGTILWRLGGVQCDFEKNFSFSRQHHVRFISVTKTETLISLFNNAWEGTNEPSQEASEGQLIKLNNETMKATLIQRYVHPDGELSEGRGSTQLLPNGNVLVGFGRVPDLVEYASNGAILMYARISEFPFEISKKLAITSQHFSYRIFKFPWTGKPHYPPKLLAYSLSCSTSETSPLIAYVSWNGATEVVAWRFLVSSTTKNGPWLSVGDFVKEGFETMAHLSTKIEAQLLKFTPYVMVQAISGSGEVLATQTVRTFVPKNKKKYLCNKYGCLKPDPFIYDISHASSCRPGLVLPEYIALGMVIVTIELCFFVCRILCEHFRA